MTEHLKPLERAARIYCEHAGIDPDDGQEVRHPVILGQTVKLVNWHQVAEHMYDLNMMLASMKQAAQEKQEAPINGVAH